MNKQAIEEMCRKAGLPPAHRGQSNGVDVIVADGYVSPVRMPTFQKFGIDANDFPMGFYATIWWAMKDEEKFAIACPLFFNWNHDSEYGQEGKKRARITAAMADANQLLSKAKDRLING